MSCKLNHVVLSSVSSLAPLVDRVSSIGQIVVLFKDAKFGLVLDSIVDELAGVIGEVKHPVVVVIHVDHEIHRLSSVGVCVDLEGVVVDVTVWSE